MDEQPVTRIRREASSRLPTRHGSFLLVAYRMMAGPLHEEHVALVKAPVDGIPVWGADPVLVRLHSECLTGDVFASRRCDCGEQLQHAMKVLAHRGRGVLVYLRQEGRGIGLVNKVRAYALQDRGKDTVEANLDLGFRDDLRDYRITAQILQDLGVGHVELLTNNPRKIEGLEQCGVRVTRRVPIAMLPNDCNRRYLDTKRTKMGHWIEDLVPRTED